MSIYIKIKTKPVNDFDGNATITRIKRKNIFTTRLFIENESKLYEIYFRTVWCIIKKCKKVMIMAKHNRYMINREVKVISCMNIF